MSLISYADTSVAPLDLVIPFSPEALFGAADNGYYFDFSDINTLFHDTAGTVPITASGQTVARVNDKSGKGNHLTQATVANQPRYIEEGGKKFLRFDGSDMLLSATARSFNVDPVDFMAVARETSEVVSAGVFVEGVPATNDWTTPQGFVLTTSTTAVLMQVAGFAFALNANSNGAGAMPKSNVEMRRAGTIARAFRDGVQLGGNATVAAGTTVANAQLVVGARMLAAGPGTYFFNGDIGGVFRISRTLSALENNTLRTFMDALL